MEDNKIEEAAKEYALTQYDEEDENIKPEDSFLIPCQAHFKAGANYVTSQLIERIMERKLKLSELKPESEMKKTALRSKIIELNDVLSLIEELTKE